MAGRATLWAPGGSPFSPLLDQGPRGGCGWTGGGGQQRHRKGRLQANTKCQPTGPVTEAGAAGSADKHNLLRDRRAAAELIQRLNPGGCRQGG